MADGTCCAAGCTKPARGGRSECFMHAKRRSKYGSHDLPYELTPAGRFFAKVDKTGDCWLWTGCLTHGGYGQLTSENRKWSAHRFAYSLLVGPIPEGLDLDHLCRVRNCVNPAHLEPVTRAENLHRGFGTGFQVNASKTHCAQGHPYDEANTIYSKRGRICRTCRNRWRRERRARKRQESA